MAEIPMTIVDAFTDKPFSGNPAAIVITSKALEEGLMQSIAAELNLSETAFVVAKPSQDFTIRWFTPLKEMPLCGHATLAAAAVLFEQHLTHSNKIEFQSCSGHLIAMKKEDQILLDFPRDTYESVSVEPELFDALGLKGLPSCFLGQKTRKLMVHVTSEEEIRHLTPNFTAMLSLKQGGQWNGIGITAQANTAGTDFVSRYFHPWAGVNEDPVTGSLHTVLGPFWQAQLGKTHLVAQQLSKRGGILHLDVSSNERILISGSYRIILKGILSV